MMADVLPKPFKEHIMILQSTIYISNTSTPWYYRSNNLKESNKENKKLND